MLEEAGAIKRGWVNHNGQKQRVIYPATGIMLRQGPPRWGWGGTPSSWGPIT